MDDVTVFRVEPVSVTEEMFRVMTYERFLFCKMP